MGLPLLQQYSMKRVKPNPEATCYISAIQGNKSRFEFQHPLDPFYGQALCQVLKEERQMNNEMGPLSQEAHPLKCF